MPEHRPPAALVAIMAGFLVAMAAAALVFWTMMLIGPGGLQGVIGGLGPGATSLFGALHVPAAVASALLWHWRRKTLAPVTRACLEATMIYFWGVVLLGLFSNAFAASLLGRIF